MMPRAPWPVVRPAFRFIPFRITNVVSISSVLLRVRGERLQIDANLRRYSRFRFYPRDSCYFFLLYFPFPTKRVLTCTV